LLPAPDAGLRLAGPSHDLDGADALSAKQDALRAPNVLLRCVAVLDRRGQAAMVSRRDGDRYSCAHAQESHDRTCTGIANRTLSQADTTRRRAPRLAHRSPR
jgi:hypothetical protein